MFSVLVFAATLFVAAAAHAQPPQAGRTSAPQQPQQQQPGQTGGWYCPWCGAHHGQSMGPGMGCGMMDGQMMGQGYCPGCGYGMGPMMGQGYQPPPTTTRPGAPSYGQQGGQPLTEDQARTLVQNYLQSTSNPNLKVGKITKDKDKTYYSVDITTQNGSLVDKLQVNEFTGWLRSAYAQ